MKRKINEILSLILIILMISGCAYYETEDTISKTPVGTSRNPAADENNDNTLSEVESDQDRDIDFDNDSNNSAENQTKPDPSNNEPQYTNFIDGIPVVFFTSEITPESLITIYRALGVEPTGNIAIKVHTGEPPNSNYLRPVLIGDLIRLIDGTIVETNAVAGLRASNAMHMQVAKDHGFLDLAPFDLLDADGEVSLPINVGEVLTEVYLGANFFDYDYYVVLSHFKGHGSAGYGGAIKNLAIGLASAPGKSLIHSGGVRRRGYTGDQDMFLKGMAEASYSIIEYLDGNLLYINVMNRLSVDCDCIGNPTEPDMHDIGILASLDPVALDQACIDLVYAAPDGASLVRRIEARNGILTLEHAAAIGLGSREYILVSIDD